LNNSTHDSGESRNGKAGETVRVASSSAPATTSLLFGRCWWTSIARTLRPCRSSDTGRVNVSDQVASAGPPPCAGVEWFTGPSAIMNRFTSRPFR
jgi:hypothetical protein